MAWGPHQDASSSAFEVAGRAEETGHRLESVEVLAHAPRDALELREEGVACLVVEEFRGHRQIPPLESTANYTIPPSAKSNKRDN